MMEHMNKVFTMAEGKHSLAYEFLLNWVFETCRVELHRGILETIKQSFSLNTLVECDYGDSRVRAKKSPMSNLVDQSEAL